MEKILNLKSPPGSSERMLSLKSSPGSSERIERLTKRVTTSTQSKI